MPSRPSQDRNKTSYKNYILLACALFFFLSLSTLFVTSLRGKFEAALFPFLQTFSWAKTPFVGKTSHLAQEKRRLEAENLLLRNEVAKAKLLLGEMQASLSQKIKVVNASIILRDSKTTSSSFWIDVGEETNRRLGTTVVSKNSPVVFGKAVVGVIDFVGKKNSRCRLLTDTSFHPSAAVVRGQLVDQFLGEQLEITLRALLTRSDLLQPEEKKPMIKNVEEIRKRNIQKKENVVVSRGILEGVSAPLWREKEAHLKGYGFSVNPKGESIHKHDLLVTTGLDGVFPEGLFVGVVSAVSPLKEGSFAHEIEARPVVPLSSIKVVSVLPPIECEVER